MVVVVVEGLVRKVLFWALDAELIRFNFWNDIVCLDGVDEHVLLELYVVEKIQENSVIINEAGCYIWVAKASNWDRVVVHIQQRIHIYVKIAAFGVNIWLFFGLTILFEDILIGILTKVSQSEATIIHVGAAVVVAIGVLLNVFHFDIPAFVVLLKTHLVIVS